MTQTPEQKAARRAVKGVGPDTDIAGKPLTEEQKAARREIEARWSREDAMTANQGSHTMTLIDPTAADKLRAAIEVKKLKAGSWGDGTHAVCMMSALVPGADSTAACVTAGWPKWLVDLNVYLFDAEVGADDEGAARAEFALRVAELVQTPRDYDKARDLFLIRRLDDGDHSALKSLRVNPVDADWWRDCEAAVLRMADLLRRRVAGEDVAEEMKAAARAADAAADAAYFAAHAAYLAARAAAAAYSAASSAAYAAARADLIIALEGAVE